MYINGICTNTMGSSSGNITSLTHVYYKEREGNIMFCAIFQFFIIFAVVTSKSSVCYCEDPPGTSISFAERKRGRGRVVCIYADGN